MRQINKFPPERRKRLRLPFNAYAVITPINGEAVEGVLVNISINGLYVKTEKKLRTDEVCHIDIFIKGKSCNLTVSAVGTVVCQDASGAGLRFTKDLELWPLFCILSQYGKQEHFFQGNPLEKIFLKAA